jgi:hypothetical protein
MLTSFRYFTTAIMILNLTAHKNRRNDSYFRNIILTALKEQKYICFS